MIIGRLTAPDRQAPHPVQLRVPASLRGHAAQGRHRGLSQPRRRLDRPRQQRRALPVAGSDVDRRARLLRRAVLPQSGVVDDAGDQQAAPRGRATRAFRYNPIFGHPPPDGITNLIPVTEQSNAINPATGQRYAPQPNYTYRGVAAVGMGGRQDRRLAGDGVVRDRRAQPEGRLPGQPAGPARSDDRRTRRSSPTASTRACRTRSATGCPTSAVARSRTCTASSSRTAGRAAASRCRARCATTGRRATRRSKATARR